MTDRLSEKQVDALITAYLDGTLNEADRPAFEAWLRASPDHPRRVARLSATDFALRKVCHDTRADYLLDILNQIDDASGPAQLVTLHRLKASQHNYRLYAIGGAVAAVLVLAITLIFVITGKPNPPSTQPLATTPEMPVASAQQTPRGPDPGPVGPALNKTVATLTAERDAVWSADSAEGALAPGSPLRAGDRLTLTQGFAEITTARGAIAILEAPAAIELTDSDNALRLKDGKLFGICETEASKGFLVRTPSQDIIDVGTEFGAWVSQSGEVTTEVFSGSVHLNETNVVLSVPPIRLVEGQTASNVSGQVIVAKSSASQSLFTELFAVKEQIRWMAYRDRLMRDGSVFAYYSFEDSVDGLLPNIRGDELFDGRIFGARWVQGRFPDKRGLQFDGPGTRHRVELSQAASDRMNLTNSFSVMVWFKSEPFSDDWQSLIGKGDSQWRLARNTAWRDHPHIGTDAYQPSALNFGYDNMVGKNTVDLPGKTGVDDGQWRQAVIVFDVDSNGQTATKYLYINGISDADPVRVKVIPADTTRVWIGNNQTRLESKRREFNGVIDEVAIFKRALSEDEVRELYQLGKPDGGALGTN